MHRLQVGIGLVEAVLLAVLGEGLNVAVPVDSGVVDTGGGAVVVVALVDVVAEAEHQVEVLLLSERRVGRVIASLVVLTGEEADADRPVRVGRRKGPEATDSRVGPSRVEAVEVLAVRGQTTYSRVDGEVVPLERRDLLAPNDVTEATVLRNLEFQQRGAVDFAEAGPELDPTRRRLPGRDPVQEGALGRPRVSASTGQRCVIERGRNCRPRSHACE